MITTTKSLFALSCIYIAILIEFTSSQQYLINSWGKVCALGVDDPPPNGCKSVDEIKTDNGLGKIECGGNFDCCLCLSMICGSKDGSSTCDELNCNGDNGCEGVGDIQIYGSDDGGATLNCNGDVSCNSTVITGKNIKEIGCSGDDCCAYSIFNFNCLEDSPCIIGCNGDKSCIYSQFIIDNTAGVECSSGACKYATFQLLTNKGGGSIICSGVDSCNSLQVIINNIQGIICGGMSSCLNASFTIIDPHQDFSIECSAPQSCQGLKLEIIINSDDITFFKGFSCGGKGCIDAQITIINNAQQYITIESLQCEAPESCKNAKFNFYTTNSKGGIGFESCRCGEYHTFACDGITGIDSCIQGLTNIKCNNIDGCKDLQQQIANPSNGFELFCSNKRSCKGLWLQIILNNNNRENTNYIKTLIFNEEESGMDAIIQLNNDQSDDIIVIIDTIQCLGLKSCENTKFLIVGDNVEINKIICDSSTSCNNCFVENISTNNNIQLIPCSTFNDI